MTKLTPIARGNTEAIKAEILEAFRSSCSETRHIKELPKSINAVKTKYESTNILSKPLGQKCRFLVKNNSKPKDNTARAKLMIDIFNSGFLIIISTNCQQSSFIIINTPVWLGRTTSVWKPIYETFISPPFLILKEKRPSISVIVPPE